MSLTMTYRDTVGRRSVVRKLVERSLWLHCAKVDQGFSGQSAEAAAAGATSTDGAGAGHKFQEAALISVR
jgi:hypothetical protein